MKSKFNIFQECHHQSSPLILGNVWDVTSAKLFEELNFSAIGTSSAAVAFSMGYEDGENIPFNEYLTIVKRITANVDIPVSVDLEAGFGDTPEQVVANIKELCKVGVVGINLEDSILKEGKRSLVDAESFSANLKEIREALQSSDVDLFINLRSDAFLLQLPNALEESLRRIEMYKDYIDGIFLPFIYETNDISQVTKHFDLPLNVLCMPDLPDFKRLEEIGVKRISTGNFIHGLVSEKLKELAKSVVEKQSFKPLFEQKEV